MTSILNSKIEELKSRFEELKSFVKIDEIKSEIGNLETRSMQEDFWADQENAQKIMQRIGALQREVETFEAVEKRLNDLAELASLNDESLENEIVDELDAIEKEIDKLELKKYLGGKFDKSAAILSIHAGQGGTEAMDWAGILSRMYLRYAEKMGWVAEILDEVRGQEAGYSSITIEIKGSYAFGYLKKEHGTHRLVRISPFNAQGLRQTSFAGVEVMPVVEEDIDIEIKPEEIEFSAVRSGGKGGQNVNKVSTAVRIKHIPTGISVSCSSERSQLQNRENAMKLLKSKLYQIEEIRKLEELSKVKGEHKIAGWGNQIRNYILQPYKLVKDLRTNVESTNPEAVLDGELEEFVEAEIRLE